MSRDSLHLTNRSQSLRNCLVSVTATNIFDHELHVVAFFDEWKVGEEVEVWSGKRNSFGPTTDADVEILCFNERFEPKPFTFSERVRESCDFACQDIETACEKDRFQLAIDQADRLRRILAKREIEDFDDRIDAAEELARKGLTLVAQRGEWTQYFADNTRLTGDYRNGRDRARVGCEVTHVDNETGDLRLRCYVQQGRKRTSFSAVGKVDIVPEENLIQVSLTKPSSRSRQKVNELTLEKKGRALIGRDDDGGRISFRPYRG